MKILTGKFWITILCDGDGSAISWTEQEGKRVELQKPYLQKCQLIRGEGLYVSVFLHFDPIHFNFDKTENYYLGDEIRTTVRSYEPQTCQAFINFC